MTHPKYRKVLYNTELGGGNVFYEKRYFNGVSKKRTTVLSVLITGFGYGL